MNTRKRLTCLLLTALCLTCGTAHAQLFDFETDERGKMNPSIWSETYMTNTDQMLLYKVEDTIGIDGSQGLKLETPTARSSYRLLNTAPQTGKRRTISASFRIEIDENYSAQPNHPLFGVFFNTSDKWFNGKRVDMMLLRRTNKELPSSHYGLTSQISKGAPAAWIIPEKIGLPHKLDENTPTALSSWFSMTLVLEATDGGLWNVYCYLLDADGNNIEAVGATDIELAPEFTVDGPIYGGITVGWSANNQYQILDEAGLKSTYVDNVEINSSN